MMISDADVDDAILLLSAVKALRGSPDRSEDAKDRINEVKWLETEMMTECSNILDGEPKDKARAALLKSALILTCSSAEPEEAGMAGP